MTIKFSPDWFLTVIIIKILDNDLLSNDDTIFVNEDPNYSHFLS